MSKVLTVRPRSSDPRPALAQLSELKWLRGGVLATHAFLDAIDQLDDDARKRVDLSALVYLTEQMQYAVLHGGALDAHIQELDSQIGVVRPSEDAEGAE